MIRQIATNALVIAILVLAVSCNKGQKAPKDGKPQREVSTPSLVENFKNKAVLAIGLDGKSWDTKSSFMDYYSNFQGETYEWEEDDDSMVLISKQPDQKGNINKVEMYFRQSPQNKDGVILYRIRANRKDVNDRELYQLSIFYADFMQKIKKELKKKAKK